MTTPLKITQGSWHGRKMKPKAYLAMERSTVREKNGKYELFNQKLRFMAGASEAHNTISTNLVTLFNMYLWQHDLIAHIYQSDMKVVSFLSYKNYVYPDIIFIKSPPQFDDLKTDVLTNPTLIIEVLSDETEAFDRGDKFQSYCKIDSLQEYLLVSQYEKKIEHFYKGEDGVWRVGKVYVSGALQLLSLPLSLSLNHIYRQVNV